MIESDKPVQKKDDNRGVFKCKGKLVINKKYDVWWIKKFLIAKEDPFAYKALKDMYDGVKAIRDKHDYVKGNDPIGEEFIA